MVDDITLFMESLESHGFALVLKYSNVSIIVNPKLLGKLTLANKICDLRLIFYLGF